MSQGRLLLMAAIIGGLLALAGAGVGAYFAVNWMRAQPSNETSTPDENAQPPRVQTPSAEDATDSTARDRNNRRLAPGSSITYDVEEGTAVYQVALMYGDASIVLPGEGGHRPRVIELSTREVAFEGRHLNSQTAWIRGLDDGSRFLVISEDGDIDIYRRGESGNYRRDIVRDRVCEFPMDVDVSADGTHAAFVCEDLTIRLINIESGRNTSLRGSRGGFNCATFAHDGSEMIAASQRNELFIWNVASGQRLLRVPLYGTDEPIAQVGWLTETDGFYAVTSFGRLFVWTTRPKVDATRVSDAEPDYEAQLVDQPVNLIDNVPASGRLALVTGGTEIQVWDIDAMIRDAMADREGGTPNLDPRPTRHAFTREQIESFSMDSSGTIVAAAMSSGTVVVMPLEEPRSSSRRGRR